ncbi:BZ3500_MvSof-1268-A1-R1_Chr3-1g05662 [Microbotryum saponariae]|uniref:BZ3500_MvSof-1268-A1-R1_Chr3-1g05662 protein n=1 Tax=Microbotryum saponariae TaxID=289078 RepID=A0A2X0LIN9_9BASI|nr:BZ3500_MvSof-1268-A1-R1_Chr3-1g05662 [Microbotryum saponariae]SDA04852.1 BZ3501_MvSof-1269-A2-R1_Chr3-1g05332 [Microbotryum saponariae]
MIRRTYATSAELEAIAAPAPPPQQQQQQPRGAQPPASSLSSSAQINTLLEATIPEVEEEATMAYLQEEKTTVQVEEGEIVERVEQGVDQQMGSSEPINNPPAATLRLPSLSSSLNSLPNRPLSQIPTPHSRRASHSPDRKHRRSNSLTSETGSLLALPVAAQLHALKARNTSLEATVTNWTAQHQLAMFKATSRIASLEKALAEQQATTKVETGGPDPSTTIFQQAAALAQDVEGWQAEAQRLQLELDSLSTSQKTEHDRISYELELEKSKKKTYRFLCAKLRSELHNRKAKEKWDLGVMDAADRARDVNEVQLEATIATLRMQVGIAKVDAEELQETIHRQRKKISALSASRSMLLNTVNASEATTSALRSEINLAKTGFTKETKALQKEVNALRSSLKDVKKREVELEKNVEEMAELKTEIKALKAEALRLEKGEKRSESKDAKELGEVRKSLEKEKTKREKVEAEVKEVKALLKSTQVALKDAQRSAALKSQAPAPSATSNVARKTHAAVHVASDPVVASEPEDDDDDDDEEEEEGEEEVVPAPVVKAKKTSTTLAPVVDEPASDDQGGEVYKPQKSRSRSVALPQKTKAIIAAATADVESEREGVAASKKRKMLGDKSGNTSTSPKREELMAVQPKKMKVVVKAKTAKMGLKEVLAEQAAEEEDEESTAPKKKKKRTLFGGGGKFAWDLIENADVNSLGLPSHLSPIKGGGGLGLGGTRPATTLGILGRGLTGGRKSIFS